MSSTGQASDLSMDEILASIRKIISEDPKTVAAQPRPATGTAAQASNRPVAPPMSAPMAPPTQTQTPTPGPLARPVPPAAALAEAAAASRTAKLALDDDILDLMDEDRGTAAVPPPAPPAAPKPAPPSATTIDTAAPPARSSLNDMWTPREWPRAPEATAPQQPSATTAAKADVRRGDDGTSESRLEAAIAALGQSLAAPAHNDLPAKPIVVASAPKIPAPNGPHPGPRIDVVAVVNAAQRAALAQRSADEQASMPAIVGQHAGMTPSPSASPRVAEQAAPAPTAAATLTPEMPTSAISTDRAIEPPVAPPSAATPTAATPDVPPPAAAPSVNAAVEAAMAAARAAPPRVEAAKPVATPVAALVPEPAPIAAVKPAKVEPVAPPAPPVVAAEAPTAKAPESVVAPPAGVQTLEDTVARLLRPMLRQWLDDNMPRIVEKAFKEELAAQAAPPPVPRRAN